MLVSIRGERALEFLAARSPSGWIRSEGRHQQSLHSRAAPQNFVPMRWHAAVLALIFGVGCATAPPLEPVDLSAPGWRLREGQALWKRSEDAPELAGEVVLATHARGSFIRFSKTLPIVTARWEGDRWEAEFPPQDKRYSGRGSPPKRISWFNLLAGMEGRELPEDWVFTKGADGSALLVNRKSGERLEVHFNQ